MHWTGAFVLTLGLEAAFIGAVRATTPVFRSISLAKFALLLLGANLLTHPVVWHLSGSAWADGNPVTAMVSLEAFAILTEGAIYARAASIPWPMALLTSLGANLLSLGVGLILLTS
ncbi:MAG TPA: hypothetical protein VK968_06940 [Roseimicrobium sp.]|nr:hypothetical protein [Roseimicrobium sp.]